jgi:O-antigen ligase
MTIVACILVTASLVSVFEGGFSLIELISKNRARISAIINNIEAATNFYVVSFPFLIGLLLIKTRQASRYLIWITLFYIVAGLILAMSRSAIIGIAVSSAIIFFILQRRRFYQFLFSLVVMLLLFLLYEPLAEITYFFFRIEEGLSAREQTWTMAINIIKDHPLFGIGPGAYKYEMFNYFPYMLDDWWGRLFIYYHEVTEGANFSHNFFLVFFSDMGVLGLLTAIFLPIIYFKIGIETIKKYKSGYDENYYLIVVLFAAGTSIIARNFFNSIGILFYGGVTTDLPFWLIFISLIYFNYNSPKRLDKCGNSIDINEE